MGVIKWEEFCVNLALYPVFSESCITFENFLTSDLVLTIMRLLFIFLSHFQCEYHLYFVVVRQEEWKEKRSTDPKKSNISEQIHITRAVSSGSWDESWGCWELTYHSVEVSSHSQHAPQTSNPCPLQIWSSHPLYALLRTSGLWNKVPNHREMLDSLWSQTLKEVSKVALRSPSLEHQYLSVVLSFFEVSAVL